MNVSNCTAKTNWLFSLLWKFKKINSTAKFGMIKVIFYWNHSPYLHAWIHLISIDSNSVIYNIFILWKNGIHELLYTFIIFDNDHCMIKWLKKTNTSIVCITHHQIIDKTIGIIVWETICCNLISVHKYSITMYTPRGFDLFFKFS